MSRHNMTHEIKHKFAFGEQVNSVSVKQIGNVEISVWSGKVLDSGKKDNPCQEIRFYINDSDGNRLAEVEIEHDINFRIGGKNE